MSTQSGGMPTVAPSNTVSATAKHSVKGHANEEKVTAEITADLEESTDLEESITDVADNG